MKKNFFLVFISIFVTVILINFCLIFFSNKVFNQKYFPRTLLNFFSKYYAIFYHDTNDRTLNNYIAIIGDSVAFGSGDEYLSRSYNYSIAHKLRKKTPNKNYINFGFPGAGNYSSSEFFLNSINKNFPFPKIEKPNRIIYLFYEGNDLENNLHFINAGEKLKEKISFYRNLIDYFPVVHFLIGSVKKIFIGLNKNENYYQENIIILKKNNGIKKITVGNVQAPPLELNGKQIDLALEVLFNSLKKIKLKYPKTEILVVYIPSIATVHNFYGDISFQKYFNDVKIKKSKKKEIDNLSLNLRNYINKKSFDEGYGFLDSSNKLIDEGKFKLLFGPIDFKHFNKEGYNIVAELICEKIKC